MREILATIGTLTGFSLVNILVIFISTRHVEHNRKRIDYMLVSSFMMSVALVFLILAIARDLSGIVEFTVTALEFWFLAMAITMIIKSITKLYHIKEVVKTYQVVIVSILIGLLAAYARMYNITYLFEFIFVWIVLVPFGFLIYYIAKSNIILYKNIFFYLSLILFSLAALDILIIILHGHTTSVARIDIVDYIPIVIGTIVILSIPAAFLSELQREESTLYKNKSDELTRTVETIKELSYRDTITNLFNRRKVNELLLEWIIKGNDNTFTFSLLMCDIDSFKKINDTYGHLSGDAVLTYVGNMLQSNTRKQDVIARFGGDEFIVLLPDTNEKESIEVVSKIKRAFEQSNYSKIDMKITLSVGISNWTKGVSLKTLLDQADSRMYMDKNKSKKDQ